MLRVVITSFVLSAAAAVPAVAEDCAGSHAVDRCLVGTWKMTTNGMEQWMRTHIRNFHVTNTQTSNNTITLNADGSFATGASQVKVEGAASNGMTGTGKMNAQASGVWSAAAGKLNLCTHAGAMNGSATVTNGGHSTTTPIHQTVPPVSSQSYTCSGATFTTSQPLRGDTVVSTYTKQP